MVKVKAHVGLVAAGVGLALVVLGYAGWVAHQKRAQRQAVNSVIQETTALLRESLASKPDLKKFEANAAAADASLETLKSAGSRDRKLADGAELYVVNAREIFKRQAAVITLAEKAGETRRSLETHMGRAQRRDQAWIDEAMSRKKKVEAQYFDYNLALTGLSELLWKFPDTRKALLPHVQDTLPDEIGPAEAAYRRYQDEARRVAGDLDTVRRIAPR